MSAPVLGYIVIHSEAPADPADVMKLIQHRLTEMDRNMIGMSTINVLPSQDVSVHGEVMWRVIPFEVSKFDATAKAA